MKLRWMIASSLVLSACASPVPEREPDPGPETVQATCLEPATQSTSPHGATLAWIEAHPDALGGAPGQLVRMWWEPDSESWRALVGTSSEGTESSAIELTLRRDESNHWSVTGSKPSSMTRLWPSL